MIGRTVSHYRITEELGRGGMGVVFKAEDLRLGRTVALKFLSEHRVNHPGAFDRLWQEARAASSLNHPHICTVYEIGEEGGQVFIAMECVEGETLRQRIARKPLRLDEILDIGIQIANGLNAAHAKKIIHRDIKSANIFIRPGGQVKIMDFGLARLVSGDDEAGAGADTTATLPAAAFSSPGAIAGTLTYMSPEQTRGEDLDARTDLFSFGVVLYEMVTGRLPFQGDTTATILKGIQTEAPLPAMQLRPDLPSELASIIDTALEKDRNLRFQTASEIRAALARVKRDSSSERAVVSKPPASARPKPNWRTGTIVAVLGAGAVLGGFLAYRSNDAEPFQNIRIERITGTGGAQDAAISPDGNYVVYVLAESGRQSLWLRHIPTTSSVQLAALSSATYSNLSYSADGNFIYYLKLERVGVPAALYRMPALGGAPQKLIEDMENVALAADGKQAAFVRSLPNGESALLTARMDGTGQRKLVSFRRPDVLEDLAWSPDGKVVAFGLISWRSNVYTETVHAIAASGGSKHVIHAASIPGLEGLCWAPDGRGLLLEASDDAFGPNQIYYMKYPSGELMPVTHDVNSYEKISASRDARRLASILSERRLSLWLAAVSSPGESKQVRAMTSQEDGHYGVAWTEDNRFVYTSRASGKLEIWMGELGGRSTQLTSTTGGNLDPCVTGDNRYIVFTSNRGGGIHLWRMELDGSHVTQLTSDAAERWPACSADGRWILYSVVGSGEITSWRIPIEGGRPVRIYDGYASRPQLSPDGKYVAFRYRNEKLNPRRGFAVMPIEGGEPRPLPEITGVIVRWAKDGKALYFLKNANGATNVWIQPVSGGKPTQATRFTSDNIDSFDISRDGTRLLCARASVTSDVVLITSGKP